MTNSFSVVTPSYNQGHFIRSTIERVLAQKIPDLQYLVMDGGSNDSTVGVLNEYHNQLTFISEQDEGTADAINKGLALCEGEIIGWLNSDEIYYPGALQRVLEIFRMHPEVDVIYGRAHHISEQGAILEEYPTAEWSFEQLINHCIISQPESTIHPVDIDLSFFEVSAIDIGDFQFTAGSVNNWSLLSLFQESPPIRKNRFLISFIDLLVSEVNTPRFQILRNHRASSYRRSFTNLDAWQYDTICAYDAKAANRDRRSFRISIFLVDRRISESPTLKIVRSGENSHTLRN